MIFVPGTSAKPARAAFPVSPEVATRMTVSLSGAVFDTETVKKYGNICRAISLNAQVGPCHSSKICFLPMLSVKLISLTGSPPNFSGA